MEHLAALETELRDVVAKAAATPAPALTFGRFREFADTGERYGYEVPYFERRGRLAALAAILLLASQRGTSVGEEVLNLLADELWQIGDEYTWALPAHFYHAHDGDEHRCIDLFAAETAHTLAETLALAGDRLDGRVTRRVRAEILDRVLIPFSDDPRPLAWESFENNWLAVCAGSVGMSALGLLRDGSDSELLQRVLNRSLRSMERFLASFGADGGCAEGVSYWVYGFGYFVYFAEAYREHGGPDLLDDPKVRELAAFPARVGFGGGRYPAFSDAAEEAFLPSGLVSRLVERFGGPVADVAAVPSFAADHCHHWAHLSRDILWTDPAVLGRGLGPSSVLLADLGWVVDRDGGGNAFAAKGGHNDEPHNHLDLGHFVLHVGGETLIDDLGAGKYTRDYFGDKRYTVLQPSAAAHNAPILGGRPQLAGADRRAVVTQHSSDAVGTVFHLDLTAAYDVPGLLAAKRLFSWRRSGLLHVTDEISTDTPLPVEICLVSRRRPEIGEDRIVWQGSTGSVSLDRDRFLRPELEELETIGHLGASETVHQLRLRGTAAAGTTRFLSVFTVSTVSSKER